METKLTIQEKLKDLRVIEKKKKLKEVAGETGISVSSLSNYESNEFKDISPFALVTLAKYYGVSTDYLLGLTEARNHPDVKVAELHLSDDMLELLRSDKINHRLLNEFATHERFRMLLTDMEIYVDRIADMNFQTLALTMQAHRAELKAQFNPDPEDVQFRTLELCQVKDVEFVSRVIHDDIDAILQDIREAHKNDKTTADEGAIPTVESVKQLYSKAKANPTVDTVFDMYVEQLGIPRDEISEIEENAFKSLVSKARKTQMLTNMRGRVIPHGHGNGKRKR